MDALTPSIGPQSSPARLLLSEREAAAVMGVSVRLMLDLRNNDGLPFVRIGARVMYRPADLAAWVDGRRTSSTTAADDPTPSHT